MSNGFIPVHGNYKKLLSYRKSEIIYDMTFSFCSRFLSKGDRTVDQMIQAARSGKQNIIEGSVASGTSRETEIKLLNVARASLEELLEDYRDFLRTRKFLLWEKDSKEAVYVRTQSPDKDNSVKFKDFAETRSAETVANIAICLIYQANYLLDRQIKRLEQDFLKEGGLRERMFNARIQTRNAEHESHRSNESHRSHEPMSPIGLMSPIATTCKQK